MSLFTCKLELRLSKTVVFISVLKSICEFIICQKKHLRHYIGEEKCNLKRSIVEFFHAVVSGHY